MKRISRWFHFMPVNEFKLNSNALKKQAKNNKKISVTHSNNGEIDQDS